MSVETTVPAIKPSPSKPKRGGGKLLGLVIVFFITVFIILFFQSSISKISEIRVEGNELVPAEEIIAASGVEPGDHFFTTSTHRARDKVKLHPFLESVEISKSFPGMVKIQVKEYRRVAFQLAADGTKEVLLADGSALPVAGQAAHVPLDMPILSNWNADDPMKKALCAALAQVPAHLLSDISEIKPEPSVAYPDKIKLYTRSRYEVYTTIEYLPGNVEYLGYMTAELMERGKTTGVITMLEQIRHAPFESDKSQEPKTQPTKAPVKDQPAGQPRNTNKPANG
ncbi:cell division protein FtsQ/DivIB [Gorillibacterium sp. sgz5001074]|uniref:cell division protein FtsQ/DivIB n=1 Tax=Gorillibacterium sp. sgz5001074 TaxID=3446695 RepID=UPI003F67BA39